MRADQRQLSSLQTWGEMTVTGADALAVGCGGRCGLPHWGYVIRGVMRVEYPDHDEVISAGDAYYVAPGHVGIRLGGVEVVDFRPVGPPRPDRAQPSRRTTPRSTS